MGGVGNIVVFSQNLIDQANNSYSQSGVNGAQRLITALIYPEFSEGRIANINTTLVWEQLLQAMESGTGTFATLPEIRDKSRADMIVLIFDGSQMYLACGKASMMTSNSTSSSSKAYAMVSNNCAAGDRNFAHETGHILGGRHDWSWDNHDNMPFHYNHGYWNEVADFRTIMAYGGTYPTPHNCSVAGGCPRLNRWSNPNQTYMGYPLGVGEPKPTNMVETLNSTIPTVANYRSVSGLNLPTTPTLNYVICRGSTIPTLRWSISTNALWYDLEVSSNSTFSPATRVVHDRGTTPISRSYTPSSAQSWSRLRACNGAGCGSYSIRENVNPVAENCL